MPVKTLFNVTKDIKPYEIRKPSEEDVRLLLNSFDLTMRRWQEKMYVSNGVKGFFIRIVRFLKGNKDEFNPLLSKTAAEAELANLDKVLKMLGQEKVLQELWKNVSEDILLKKLTYEEKYKKYNKDGTYR